MGRSISWRRARRTSKEEKKGNNSSEDRGGAREGMRKEGSNDIRRITMIKRRGGKGDQC